MLLLLLLPLAAAAQYPCRDTVVHYYDSVCEGQPYTFNGVTLTHTGLYFDTLPRVGTECDSVVMLHFTLLDYPEIAFNPVKLCSGDVGYRLNSASGTPYHYWTSEPFDSSLVGHEYEDIVHINPIVPTNYTLYADYRPSPAQCPASRTITINPIQPVVAAMHITPDEITYDRMELVVEDYSVGNREAPWGGGWAGRKYFIDNIRQPGGDSIAHFQAQPWWGDSVVVSMVAFSPTCFDSIARTIPFRRLSLFFPNIFTPHGDINNRFLPVTKGILEYEMWLYDRRGSLVFHTTDLNEGWDGTSHGIPCPQGTYVYRCRYRDIVTPNGWQSASGSVTLIR